MASLSDNDDISVFDWIADTYDETVEYWSRDDAFEDAADAISWGAGQVKDETVETVTQISDAVTEKAEEAAKGTAKIVALAALTIGGAFVLFEYAKAKARKAGSK